MNLGCLLSPSTIVVSYIVSTILIERRILQEEFEDTKGVIKIRKSKKDRQHYGQVKTDKRYNKMTDKTHGHK